MQWVEHQREIFWFESSYYREAVAFQSPGLRRQPLPWEVEIGYTLRRRRYTNSGGPTTM
jgi:hypothetical protein